MIMRRKISILMIGKVSEDGARDQMSQKMTMKEKMKMKMKMMMMTRMGE